MADNHSRRKILKGLGAFATLTIAGCMPGSTKQDETSSDCTQPGDLRIQSWEQAVRFNQDSNLIQISEIDSSLTVETWFTDFIGETYNGTPIKEIFDFEPENLDENGIPVNIERFDQFVFYIMIEGLPRMVIVDRLLETDQAFVCNYDNEYSFSYTERGAGLGFDICLGPQILELKIKMPKETSTAVQREALQEGLSALREQITENNFEIESSAVPKNLCRSGREIYDESATRLRI